MALKNDGTLWFWGLNTNLINAVAFNGTTTNNVFYTPIQYNLIDDVKAFSLGNGNVLALKNDGTLWAWGINQFGELGIGTVNNDLSDFNVYTPIKVLLDPNSPAITVHDTWWGQAATIINMPDTTLVNATNPLPVSTENTTVTNSSSNSSVPQSQGNNSYLMMFGFIGLVAITGVIVWNRHK